MATPVIMPRQGQSVESCIIAQWHKKVGEHVNIGDILFTYETDKATFDEESKVEGEMLAAFFEEGDDVPCLLNVCVIGAKGEDTSIFDPGTQDEKTADSPAAANASDEVSAKIMDETKNTAEALIEPQMNADISNFAISPRAKALAKKNVVDLRAVAPTGPKGLSSPSGRVIERDIRKLIEEGRFATGAAGTDYAFGITGTGIGGRVSVADIANTPAAASVTAKAPAVTGPESYEEKHTSIRKLIAKAMNASLSTMAQLTLNASFDATDIIEFRAKLKKAKESGIADQMGIGLALAIPTFNDIILYAVSRVVKNHRLCNAHFYDDKMVFFNTVNIGMAVDTPRGLMVPTIFNADSLSITEISKNAKEAAAACQKGTITPDMMKNATITITNLGTLGIESFTPVINPPQTCILGVNCLVTAVKNVYGSAVLYQSMGLSLTFDHRALDGAPAARFLKDLKETLENFSLLLMK